MDKMHAKEAILEIAEHLNSAAKEIKGEQIKQFIDAILNAKRVFIYGCGRSGLVSKSFGMRLAHLNLPVFVVGETITRPIKIGDLLISITGSGNTNTVVNISQIAKNNGAIVAVITSNKESQCGKLANVLVEIPGRTKDGAPKDYLERQVIGTHTTMSPMGTLFEDTAQIFLDGIIVELMYALEATEKDMSKLHANLEV